MTKNITFKDNYRVAEAKTYSDTMNFVSDMIKSGKPLALRTIIRATHSGYLVNSRVYPGLAVEKSASTFTSKSNGGTSPYDKPVLLDHDDSTNSTIGRVIGQKFIRVKNGTAFDEDYKSPAKPGSEDIGSGYVLLNARITDQDSILKILDKRLTTVSTGQKPESARCNICGVDYLSRKKPMTDECEHYPGIIYTIEDRELLCFLITGKMEYKEVSFTPNPAQPNAMSIETAIEDLKDSCKDSDVIINSSMNTNYYDLSLIDSEGHSLGLILKEEQQDKLPDFAVKMLNKSVSFNGTKAMKEITKEAENIIDTWIKETVSTKVEDNKAETNKAEELEVTKTTDKTETAKSTTLQDVADKDKQIDALNKELDALKAESKAKIDAITADLESKNSVISNLNNQINAVQTKNRNLQANTLAVMRVIAGIANADFDQEVERLSRRSTDSLTDSINDLIPTLKESISELRTAHKQSTKNSVENPVLNHTQQDNVNEEKKLITPHDYLNHP